MNLKSDIIHMSTKWALSFLAAKAVNGKKKNWEGGSHISKPVKGADSVLYKRHTFHHHQSFTKTVPPRSNVKGCKKVLRGFHF